jgi:uncharacterized membrane protein YfcA
MTILFEQPALIIFAFVMIGLLAGFVKGAVGFAMPMIMVSGLGTLLSPELAIATLICLRSPPICYRLFALVFARPTNRPRSTGFIC